MKEFEPGKTCDMCGLARCNNATEGAKFRGRWQLAEDGMRVICQTVEDCDGKPVPMGERVMDITKLTHENITAV